MSDGIEPPFPPVVYRSFVSCSIQIVCWNSFPVTKRSHEVTGITPPLRSLLTWRSNGEGAGGDAGARLEGRGGAEVAQSVWRRGRRWSPNGSRHDAPRAHTR